MSRLPEIANPKRTPYISDLSDAEWAVVKPLLHEPLEVVPMARRLVEEPDHQSSIFGADLVVVRARQVRILRRRGVIVSDSAAPATAEQKSGEKSAQRNFRDQSQCGGACHGRGVGKQRTARVGNNAGLVNPTGSKTK